ncbi:hypothetical protein [Streptomyces sp. NPDC060333]|uniref:hypothetical protein n=1 Tax=Streptomyces sp. NPDC060333 TaxID=3347098 RepID=UPI003662EE09
MNPNARKAIEGILQAVLNDDETAIRTDTLPLDLAAGADITVLLSRASWCNGACPMPPRRGSSRTRDETPGGIEH